ncbi:hypothetical protein GCM10010975_06440 [Comamonas phosphati]|nr:hypothetical protein GCM10010975_06440 [Comamonas phosphati]
MSEQNNPGNQLSAVEVQKYPVHFQARVVGEVQHRAGDGPLESIPVGTDMKVDTAIASYVLSWVSPEDQQPETVYLAKREFEHYVEVGALDVTA